MIALLASIAGSMVLTGFAAWIVALLAEPALWPPASADERVAALQLMLALLGMTIAAVLLGLGFAINRRAFRASVGGRVGGSIELSGGEGEVAR